jgi:hypothetical protein
MPVLVCAQLTALLRGREGRVRDHPAPAVAVAGAYRSLDDIAAALATKNCVQSAAAVFA